MPIEAFGKDLASAMQNLGEYSAKAAAQANSISREAQSAQGAFNQASANQANALNQNTMLNQWDFNSAQASNANNLQMDMWQTAADWNEQMWERQAKFNADQAEKQRAWQEQMANTQYQRAIKDMSAAGLNPILAVTGAGIGTGVPGGATASVGGAQMSSAQSQMASGGLLGANSASENNYMGQMETISGTMALIGMLFNAFASASDVAGQLGDTGEEILKGAMSMFDYTNKKTNDITNENHLKYLRELDKYMPYSKGGFQDWIDMYNDLKNWWNGGSKKK